jgi:SAM-dependent methyltransferase
VSPPEPVKSALGVRFQTVAPASDAREVRARHEANRAGWNEGAQRYTDGLEDAIAFLRAGGSNLHPIERANLGNLRSWCGTAIHLQCASGRDTLSLWNEGAREVVGVDISDVHIANAERLGRALPAPATWHRADVLDAPASLDGTADLVYTGRGALCWLHDLEAWAAVIGRLLKRGGILHLFDDHPVTWLFEQDADSWQPSGVDYFGHAERSQGWPSTYIGALDIPLERQSPKFERLWPLASIFTALRRAGLTIEHFGEHPDSYWDNFPNLKPEYRGLVPRTFSMVARR